jgi:hypothetical protein
MFHGHLEKARPTTIRSGSNNEILACMEADEAGELAYRNVLYDTPIPRT